MPLPDIDDIDSFGGARVNRRPITDPTTDVGAEHLNPLMCDVAMMTGTAIRAFVVFTGITYTSGTMTIVPDAHCAVWGSATGVRPLVEQTAAGIYRATWTATQNDALGNPHSVNIRMPIAPMVFGADGLRAKVVSFTANVININTFSGGSANALNGTKMGFAFL